MCGLAEANIVGEHSPRISYSVVPVYADSDACDREMLRLKHHTLILSIFSIKLHGSSGFEDLMVVPIGVLAFRANRGFEAMRDTPGS